MDTGIRRQIGTEANRRYLRDLPIFRIDYRLPPQLRELLEKIDRSEQKRDDRQDN